MNSVLWGCLISHEISIPFNFEEAHPAYDEGYYSYKPAGPLATNPHEEDSESYAEWDDGFMQAYHNYMTRGV